MSSHQWQQGKSKRDTEQIDLFQEILLMTRYVGTGKSVFYFSFRPESALYPAVCVSFLVFLCDVKKYVSGKTFNFFDFGKNGIVLNRKRKTISISFRDRHYFSSFSLNHLRTT